MSNTVIQLKSSGTPSNIPSSLANGEIALNYADGKFYYKIATGQIVSFAGSGNVYSFSTINANNSLITAISNNSTLTIKPGIGIGITSDIINDIITISADLSAANNWANTKLANATGTLAGDLTTTGTITANSYVILLLMVAKKAVRFNYKQPVVIQVGLLILIKTTIEYLPEPVQLFLTSISFMLLVEPHMSEWVSIEQTQDIH